MTTPSNFTVLMHSNLVDEVDSLLSPLDCFAAVDQIHQELPKRHTPRPRLCRWLRRTRSLRVYSGRFAWYDLGFSYVQVEHVLHIVELWFDEDFQQRLRWREVDCVLGKEPAETA